ncbi:MAG TPA: tetratricopeptide repeat protein [Azospirillum sp.]|nr:tetratricopeptide repeat protein [Azospirillum sp.]
MRSRRRPFRNALLAALSVLALGGCQTLRDVTETGAANAASYDALMRLADSTRAQGDLTTASTLYRRAHAASDKRVEPLLGLGAVLTDMGSPREALDPWRQALARDPDNAAALRGYARALVALDQPQEAARHYAAALAADPKDVGALNGLGVARAMTGDHAGAQERFRAALALAPGDTMTLNNLAFSLMLSGATDEAIGILEPLARSVRAGAVERQNLAMAYGLAGREEDAARMGRLDLDERAVQSNLAYYRQARTGGAAWPRPIAGHAPAAPAPPPAAPARAPPPAVAEAPGPTAAPLPLVPARPPAVPSAAAGAPAAGEARIDLDAYAGEALARREWALLTGKHGALLAGREPIFVSRARASDGKPLVHLRVAFPTREEAARVCAALRSPKQECTVLRPADAP